MRVLTCTVLVTAFALSGCMMLERKTGTTDPDEDGGIGDGGPAVEDETPVSSGLSLKEVASGFTSPVVLVDPDDGTDRLFVVDQIGPVRVLEGGTLLPEPFLDLSDRIVPLDPTYDERGVLGLAFHPDFESNGRLFVYYTAPLRPGAPEEYDHTNVVATFQVGMDGAVDPASEQILLAIDHPYANHNGGTLLFGPDGYLYLSIGDGGNRNDRGVGHPPIGNGQDTSSLLGKVLRFDVDAGGLAIPDDNPFAIDGAQPGAGAEEIFAYGFRNPYRFSFDRLTGDLWLADQGQELMEEVNVVRSGGNYGWNVKEGFFCFDPMNAFTPYATCSDVGPHGDALLDPLVAYLHPPMAREPGEVGDELVDPASFVGAGDFPQLGRSVIGGFVYRGERMTEHRGRYVMADMSTSFDQPSGKLIGAERRGNAFELRPLRFDRAPGMAVNNTDTPKQTWEEGTIPWFVLGLGEDRDGELYVLVNKTHAPTGTTGRVLKLVPTDDL